MYYGSYSFMSPPRKPRRGVMAGDYYGRFRGPTTRPGMRYYTGDAIGTGIGEWLGGLIGLPSGLGGAVGGTLIDTNRIFDLPGPQGPANDSPFIPNVLEAPLERALNIGAPGARKRRSMNAANVHALRRALRRVDSFRHLAKKSGAMPAVKRFPAQRAPKCCK